MDPLQTAKILFYIRVTFVLKSQENFKAPPKKFQPKGLSILYEDRDILVADKIDGLLTVGNDRVKDNTAFYLLNNYVRKGNPKSRNRVYVVHRLDRDTSGVILFAKNEKAQSFLQEGWQGFEKKYCAIVNGVLPEKEGIITSYLAENSAHRMYSVADPEKGKLAKTRYRVIKESAKYSLLDIELLTGRKNQIRIHFSEKGNPVTGDKKYGIKERGIKRLMLHSSSLTILHPHNKEKITFKADIPVYFESLFNR